jgi:hypothetical protein
MANTVHWAADDQAGYHAGGTMVRQPFSQLPINSWAVATRRNTYQKPDRAFCVYAWPRIAMPYRLAQ